MTENFSYFSLAYTRAVQLFYPLTYFTMWSGRVIWGAIKTIKNYNWKWHLDTLHAAFIIYIPLVGCPTILILTRLVWLLLLWMLLLLLLSWFAENLLLLFNEAEYQFRVRCKHCTSNNSTVSWKINK